MDRRAAGARASLTRTFVVRTVAALLFAAAAIFALVMALLPHPPDVLGETSDKVQHMLAFAVLTALALPAFPRTSPLWILLLLAGFGAVIEVLQEIPDLHRDSSFYDWLADCGAILAVLATGVPLRWVLRGRASDDAMSETG